MLASRKGAAPGRIFVATEKLFLVFPAGMAEELRCGIPSARCDRRGAGEQPMDHCKLTSVFSAPRQLACLIAVIALAGCATTRSEVVSGATPSVPRVSDSGNDQSEVRLASAEQVLGS